MVPMVVSIPHTGTKFTASLLSCTYRHVYHRHIRSVLADPNYLIVVPLRHPQKVWITWFAEAVRKGTNMEIMEPHFWACWLLLEEMVNKHHVHFLPVDHPRRESYLQQIRDVMGQPYETDWTPVNQLTQKAVRKGIVTIPEKLPNLKEIYAYPFVQPLYQHGMVYV